MSATVTRTVVTTSTSGSSRTCVWSWSYFFSIMDCVVGGLVTAQGLVLVFTAYATFRMVVIGILATIFGVNVLLSSLFVCETIYNSTRFYWSWLGRGIFFIILGCIAGDDYHRAFGFVTFLVCIIMGFVYIALQFCATCCQGLPSAPTPLCGATFITTVPTNTGRKAPPRSQQTGHPKFNANNPMGGPDNADECVA